MTDPSEIDELRLQMAHVRGTLRKDVRSTVEDVRRLVDWRPLAQKYAWVGLLGATAVGYWLVPRRTIVPAPEVLQASRPNGFGISIAKASGQLVGRALVGYIMARMKERIETQRAT